MKIITISSFIVVITVLLFGSVKAQYLTESFEGSVPPAGWSMHNSALGVGFIQGSSQVHSGTFSAFHDYSLDDNEDTLISTQIDLSLATTPRLVFWSYVNWAADAYNHEVLVSTDSINWSLLWGAITTEDTWDEITVNLAAYSGTSVYIAFRYVGNNGAEWYVDDVIIEEGPACPDPSGLSAITTDVTAFLSWNENGLASEWQIEYDTSGFTQGTGNFIDSIMTNPFLISGLSPLTTYQFYVSSICSSGDTTIFVGPFSFTTQCPQMLAPYVENFDNAGIIPNCWVNESTNDYDWEFLSYTASSGGAISGDHTTGSGYFAYFDSWEAPSGAIGELTSPIIDISGLTTPYLTFFYSRPKTGYTSRLEVNVFANGVWSNDIISGMDQQTSGWEEVNMDISTYKFADFRIQFKVEGDWYRNIGLDDVSIDEMPACFPPTSLNASNLTDNSAFLTWVSDSLSLEWNIEWGLSGFTPGSGVMILNDTTNSYFLTGLTTLTDHDFYVQGLCGVGDTSIWSAPYTFSTLAFCPDPSELFVTAQDTSATLSWVENGDSSLWNVQYGTTGFPLDSGITISGTSSNPLIISGLIPETSYDFYVQSDCGSDSSFWIGPASFTTLCSAIIAPATEKFENGGMIPACWTNLLSDDIDWSFGLSTPSTGTGPQSGDHTSGSGYFAYTESSSPNFPDKIALLTSPLIDISGLSNPGMNFWYHMLGLDMGELHVDIYDTVWHNDIFVVSGEQGDIWIERWVDLNGYTSPIITRFRGITGDDYESDMAIDDVSWVEMPTCFPPTSLNADTVTAFTADLSWVGDSLSNLWNIEWGITGFAQDSGILVLNDSVNPYQLSGLTPSTTYDFYVQEICGVGDTSSWSNLFSFTTLPSCPDPSGLSATTQETSAIISWTENGSAVQWVIEFDTAGFTPGTGTILTGITQNPDTLVGLSSGTTYEFYVTSFCGVGDSSNRIGPFVFSTLCSSFTAPFLETFDNGGIIPNCWENEPTNDYDWEFLSSSTSFGGAITGDQTSGSGHFAYFNSWVASSGAIGELTSAIIDITGLTTPFLTFFYSRPKTGYTSRLEVNVFANGIWSNDIIPGMNQQTPGWEEVNLDLTAYKYSDFMIQFRVVGDWYRNIGLDQVSIDEMPTCFPPTGISVDSITGSTAVISWLPDSLANDLIIEFGSTGFVQGTGTLITSITGTNYTLTGLNAETNYDFYMQTNCGSGDTSLTSLVTTFTTLVSCPAPSNLGVTNLSSSSATMIWTENGLATAWNIELGLPGFTQGTGTVFPNLSTPSYILNGIPASTSIEFYAQSLCGVGDSSNWTGPYQFTTLCNVIIPPYTESFENGGTIPDCWFNEPTNDYDWEFLSSYTGSGGAIAADNTGGGYFAFFNSYNSNSSGDIGELTSSTIDLTVLTAPELMFYWNRPSSGYSSRLEVNIYANTMWNNDLIPGLGTVTSGWTLASLDLIPYQFNDFKVQFKVVSDYWRNIGLDDVSIDEALAISDKKQGIDESIALYPNPASGEFFVQIPSGSAVQILELIDLQGQVLHIEKVAQENDHLIKINPGSLAPGIYYVKIQTSDFTTVKKISIK